jgi:hypothetical protein
MRKADQAAGQKWPADYRRCAGGAGTFFIPSGIAVGSSHLPSVTRAEGEGDEGAPNELAKQKYAQARAAVAAGTAAWQNGSRPQAASVRDPSSARVVVTG